MMLRFRPPTTGGPDTYVLRSHRLARAGGARPGPCPAPPFGWRAGSPIAL